MNSEIEWIMKEMTFHQIFLVVQFIIIPMITIDLIEKYQSLLFPFYNLILKYCCVDITLITSSLPKI